MIPTVPLCSTLPKVAIALNENSPEYLLWKDGQKSRHAMRQLSIAFEDNLSTQVDWLRLRSLQAVPDALAYCLEHPVMVGSTPVHILGITHSSDHSAEHVEKALKALNPRSVLLESCVDRTQARIAVQLPLVDRFQGDWNTITDCSDFGGTGPSLAELAKHGLLDGCMQIAQFMVASGSISGSPELTALHHCRKADIPIESIDILESIKLVQNASIDACGYTARRAGELSEGVLRQVVDEEGIISEYFRIMYGSSIASSVQPSLLYRLIESQKRSAPFADFLLRELHKVFRSKQYWCRVFLRDLYMSCRIKRAVGSSTSPVLVIVGGAHVFGIRDLLAAGIETPTHAALSLCCLFDNADNLCEAWRDVLRIESFSTLVPKGIPNVEEAGALIAMSILSSPKVSLWVEQEWQVVDTGAKEGEVAVNAPLRLGQLTNCAVHNRGTVDLVTLLLDGKIDPFSISRFESQSSALVKN